MLNITEKIIMTVVAAVVGSLFSVLEKLQSASGSYGKARVVEAAQNLRTDTRKGAPLFFWI